MRPGGLIAFDNTLWGGAVLEQDAKDADTRAIQALNTKARRRRADHAVPVAGGRRRDTRPPPLSLPRTMVTTDPLGTGDAVPRFAVMRADTAES